MVTSWVHPWKFKALFKAVLMAWRRRMKKGWVSGVWKIIPMAIWWTIRKERNQCIFEGKQISFEALLLDNFV